VGFNDPVDAVTATLAPGAVVTTDGSSVTQALAGSQQAASGVVALVDESLLAHGAGVGIPRGPLDVSQWESLQFVFTPVTVTGWAIGFSFASGSGAGGPFLGDIVYSSPDATAMVDNIPCLGPWVWIDTVATAGGTASLRVVPRRGPSGAAFPTRTTTPGQVSGLLIAANGAVIASGASTAFTSGVITGGDAVLNIRGNQPWIAIVSSIDRLGNAWEIGGMSGVANVPSMIPLQLPGSQVSVKISNTSGFTGTYSLSLVGALRRPS
jgi:hypothetical protein